MNCCRSFYNMGKTLDKCFGCAYCMLKNTHFENLQLPKDKKCAVSVNLFYGDPMLQLDVTLDILKRLEQSKHEGKVVIITKGDFSKFPVKEWEVDLHIGFSTFGIDNELDGGSLEQFENNLNSSLLHPDINFHIEYRPVIKGINDDAAYVASLAQQYELPIAYGGLYENGKKTDINFDRWEVSAYRKTLKLIGG